MGINLVAEVTDNGRLFGGVDVLDYDPVCQCQDTEGVYRIVGERKTPSSFIARVAMKDGQPWNVVMHLEDGKWKFFDVVEYRGSVRAILERHNSCARRKIAQGQAVDACTKI